MANPISRDPQNGGARKEIWDERCFNNHFQCRRPSLEVVHSKLKRQSDGRQGPSTIKSAAGKVAKPRSRTGPESKKCLERDGKVCVITGLPDPQVCHIVPLAWSSNENNLQRTGNALTYVFGMFCAEKDIVTLRSDLTSQPGCSDKIWNMICLEAQLHIWWAKGYLAFKFYSLEKVDGSTGEIVRIQFHWMKTPINISKSKPQEAVDWGDGAKLWKKLQVTNLAAHNMNTHRPVQTGDLFDISMPRDEAVRFIRMIELQWAAINILSMAGGAGCPELLDGYDVDDELGLGGPLDPESSSTSESDS